MPPGVLSYSSVDQAAKIICRLGREAMLTKLNLESVYCMVLVHPHDQVLLGIH